MEERRAREEEEQRKAEEKQLAREEAERRLLVLGLAPLLLFPGPPLRHLGFLVLLAAFLLALVEGLEIGEQGIGKLVAPGGRLRPRRWRRRFRRTLGLLLLALLRATGTLIGLQARAAHFFPRPALGLFAR